jgi:acetoin utilization deacetylase AcuC-like enzyme
MAEEIASLRLPTVLVQEGGYLTEHLPDNLAMFLAAYEGVHAHPVQDGAVVV